MPAFSVSEQPLDWKYAQQELLEKQGIDLKAEMEKKLLEMESQYRREREELELKMLRQTKAGVSCLSLSCIYFIPTLPSYVPLQEYETRIESLQRQVDLAQSMISSCGSGWEGERFLTSSLMEFAEECKWTTDQEKVARKAAIKWRYHQFTSVRDDLWGNAIFVKEANAISVELKKKVQFQFVLLTDTMYSPLPPDLLPPGEDLTLRPYPKTVVAIQVQDLKNGATHYWSIEKLKQRLEDMRSFYNAELSVVGTPAEAPYKTVAEGWLAALQLNPARLVPDRQRLESMRDMYGADQLSPCDDPMMEALMGTDPFYDRFPWFRMIGRAFVYLSNLLHNVPLVHKVAIVNEKGEVRGYLKVAIEPVNPRKFLLLAISRIEIINMHIQVEADTQKKGVRQTAKLHFRKEDFLKTYRNGENEGTTSCALGIIQQEEFSDESQKLTFPAHMKEEEEFCFRVVVLQAIDVSEQYSDVFCQFNFLHRHDEAFSTEPLKNSGRAPLSFSHSQNLHIKMSRTFLHYLHHFPIIFEAFGHFQQKPEGFHFERQHSALGRRMSTKLTFQQPSLVISTPVKSKKANAPVQNNPTQIRSKTDMLVWFEICELAGSGDYVPAVVDHAQGLPTHGVFLLHQGIQRRIKITICHERGELKWKDCQELVVGRIRSGPEWCGGEDIDVLSLGLFPGTYLEFSMDERTFFQFEAAWDSSLHNSPLLNRVSNYGDQIYMTLSAYMELEGCAQPAVITKDICVLIYARDSKISAASRFCRSLIGGISKSPEMNRVPGVYQLCLKDANDSGSPGAVRRQRRVLDTSSAYVRGEENLGQWRPRGDSLIFEHQWELEKLTRLQQVERVRLFLRLRDKLKGKRKPGEAKTPVSPCDPVRAIPDTVVLDEKEKGIVNKVVRLITQRIPVNKDPPTGNKAQELSDESSSNSVTSPTSDKSMVKSSPSLDQMSRQKSKSDQNLSCTDEVLDQIAMKRSLSGSRLNQLHFLIPEVTEERVGVVVSRKGYMNFLEEKTQGWTRRWVVVRRPYILLFRDEKDLVIRGIINLANARVEYSEDQQAMLKVPNTFSVCTNHRGFLMQIMPGDEMYDWLYAINPLLAGQMKVKASNASNGTLKSGV
ncbi:PH domain protein [Ancylostoma caninum]|uniref:PH domain protein n=1 Tax=Ancylostoma caninum TaxID=29170 RepID=A0A368FNX6_ANCCA|nr:PH domain protein [Ancylostoma caninum]